MHTAQKMETPGILSLTSTDRIFLSYKFYKNEKFSISPHTQRDMLALAGFVF